MEWLTLSRFSHNAKIKVLECKTMEVSDIFRIYSEIRDVDRECRIDAESAVQRAQPCPAQRTSTQSRVKRLKTCFGRNLDERPYQDTQPGKGNDNPFNSEEVSDILR